MQERVDVGAVLLLLMVLILLFPFVRAYLRQIRFGAKVSGAYLVSMVIRKTARNTLFESIGFSQKRDLAVTPDELEVHFLSGGNPVELAKGMEVFKTNNLVDVKSLSIYLLGGNKLSRLVSQGVQTCYISIRDVDYASRRLTLKVECLLPLGVIPDEIRKKEIQSSVIHRFRQFENEPLDASPQRLSDSIKSEILNDAFWESQRIRLLELVIEVN